MKIYQDMIRQARCIEHKIENSFFLQDGKLDHSNPISLLSCPQNRKRVESLACGGRMRKIPKLLTEVQLILVVYLSKHCGETIDHSSVLIFWQIVNFL